MSELLYIDDAHAAGTAYRAGACNIGPAEIRRRRLVGHAGVLASAGLLAGLVAVGAPPFARLIVTLPAAVSASGYLQAHLRFCAAYGSRGVMNLGETAGETIAVEDRAARDADRRKANQIGLASFGAGLVAGIVSVLLPI